MTRDPVFEAPWHAQLFALTVYLNEAGLFTWSDWTRRFGRTLAAYGVDRDLNGGDDYFTAWLEALEALLAEIQLAEPEALSRMKSAWQAAYLSTPHGTPVTLPRDS